MGRTFFVGGNWKCNGTKDSIATLCSTWKESGAGVAGGPVEVVIAPPSVYAVSAAASLPDGYQVSLQNTWTGKGGAYTGELSAEMAKDCVRWWVSWSVWVFLVVCALSRGWRVTGSPVTVPGRQWG